MNINTKVAKRQAEICIALICKLDRAGTELNQPADQALARFYRQHREYGARDRRFLSDAVFSWFRWRGWLKTPTAENIAAAILLDADDIPPQLEHFGPHLSPADLKPAGRLTLEEKAVYLRRLFNIFTLRFNECRGRACPSTPLRALSLSKGACPSSSRSPTTPLAWQASSPRSERGGDPTISKFPSIELTPAWFADFVFFPEEKDRELHLKRCVEAFQSRPPTWMRLPADRMEHFLSLLTKSGLEIESHSLIKAAVFIKGGKGFDAAKFPQIQIQDLASQCVGLCCAPQPGEHWWDMCAGAGGKSLHLADLTRDKGSILATDIRSEILDRLAKRRRQNKYQSIRPLPWDGKTDPMPEKYFNGVLVDAPCSGLGAWHRNPDARWRMDAGQIAEYAGVQKNLLEIAAGKVKDGGRLVYSTCTLTKIENADVIQGFLEKHREFRLENFVNPLNREPANGIIWVWPWEWNSNGMVIAVMKKG